MASESESQYGFKDKEKALDSLRLLEKEDPQYQKLTIRGLLGRAKRVLTLTKAEEKIKNITEAIEVFENWVKEHDTGSSKKSSKDESNDKPETVAGLGFKDKEAAEKTLEILEGRDPEYQKLAVKGLIGSSKRVLGGTKNPDKVKSIKEAVEILENFIEEFDRLNRIKDNMRYLNYEIIDKFPKPQENNLIIEFLEVYHGKAKDNYKNLRTLYPKDNDEVSWDIIRNRELSKLNKKLTEKKIPLFKGDGNPSDEHLEMIHWAYSPQPDKVKAAAEKLSKSSKRKKSEQSSSASSSSSGNDSDDDTPTKKKKKSTD